VTEPEWRFPEFGDGGDHIGARRARRAFRRCIAFCVMFVGVLWVSEWFLRYDHADRLYLSALTKTHDDSARSILRQAVIHDERANERPSPRYIQALAAREEPDEVILAYEKGFKLDPGNAPLAIRYACELQARGRNAEARQLFASALEKDPDNALPGYLEAAVLPWAGDDEEAALWPAFTHIARTNSGGRSVQFPRPAWFGGLPQTGYWYGELQRRINTQACLPLQDFLNLVKDHAREDLESGSQRNWNSWLEHLDTMGERFTRITTKANPEGTVRPGAQIAVRAGLHIQLVAAALQAAFDEARGEAVDGERIEKLQAAIDEINQYDAMRVEQLDRNRAKLAHALKLIGSTLLVLLFLFMVAYTAQRFIARDQAYGTIPHPMIGRVVLLLGPLAMFVLLLVTSVLQNRPAYGPEDLGVVSIVWWGVVFIYAAFGLVYPALGLPTVDDAISKRTGEQPATDGMRKAAQRARRAAHFSLVRRYYGIAIGFSSCFFSLWVVLYRILYGLYPWQFELLVLEPIELEVALIERVLDTLDGS
jgi:tetratricopeptide (TPR) repeat protein